MKNGTTFEKRQVARTEKRRLGRAANKKAKRRLSGAWKPGRMGNDALACTAEREKHRQESDPGIIRRSKFKRPGVPRKEV
jgi:hypothetical protein